MSDMTIRALVQIDNLQPKFAAYNGATVQGSIPLSGDTVLIGELAPGNGVFGLIDKALKASAVEATTQMVDSLRRGARAAAPDRDLLITPVDVAPAAPSLLERLAAAHGSAVPHGPDGDGHPVRLSADLRPRLDTFLEHGLRSLLLDASRIPFPAPVAADFDVPSSWATFVTAWEEGGDG